MIDDVNFIYQDRS